MLWKRWTSGPILHLTRGAAPVEPADPSSLAGRLAQRVIGAALIIVGLLALAAPFATGTWSLQFLALPMVAVGAIDFYTTISSRGRRTHASSYATACLAIAGALLLFVSPSLVATSVVAILILLLAADGLLKLGHAVIARDSAPRGVIVVNGVASLFMALVGWWLWRKVGLEIAVGVAIAGYTAGAGWRMLVAPVGGREKADPTESHDLHPYSRLGLGCHELFGEANRRRIESAGAIRQAETYWLTAVVVVLFGTHVGRMQSGDTWLGLISPFVATAGDFLMALLLGALVVLPLRLVWRRLSVRVERRLWKVRFAGKETRVHVLPRRLLTKWTDARFSFSASLGDARMSMLSAAGVVIRLGLPLAVLFAAMNTIWGFTWYFNTESWASGFYQKMAELRVDKWRASMIEEIQSAYGNNGSELFEVRPAGIDTGDFSFIVIGDPGEGDSSQYVLVDRYVDIGRREETKFLVIASDVIYPAGAMEDYEKNFYVPFKGFKKPIYAIPGNHDWFDALEGFNANFLELQAARAALTARVKADANLTSTGKGRIDRLLRRAQRLRELYGVDISGQRAPFFEVQTSDFALVAIDTGIRRTIDERQRTWLAAALERSRGKFMIAIVGHPKYAGGADTSRGDAGFAELYATLERAGANALIAGDTHAFEYYVDYLPYVTGARPVHHFINGGGGAYLSIGGALSWPGAPPTQAWAFYPGPEALRGKLDAETPLWKWPAWAWTRRFGSWPVSSETLSGIFDFNQAPFFQSFIEVRVERSKGRVVFALHGVSGPIRWRDLHASVDGVIRAGPDEPVEFVVNMRR
jgi:uncharacterized membrane protein HdeD (DUF308 family)